MWVPPGWVWQFSHCEYVVSFYFTACTTHTPVSMCVCMRFVACFWDALPFAQQTCSHSHNKFNSFTSFGHFSHNQQTNKPTKETLAYMHTHIYTWARLHTWATVEVQCVWRKFVSFFFYFSFHAFTSSSIVRVYHYTSVRPSVHPSIRSTVRKLTVKEQKERLPLIHTNTTLRRCKHLLPSSGLLACAHAYANLRSPAHMAAAAISRRAAEVVRVIYGSEVTFQQTF